MPYNYLFETEILDSLDIDLKNAIIIFDEAHNIHKISEETASF